MLAKSLADAMAQQTLDSQDHIEEVTPPEATIEPVSENVEMTTNETNDDSEQQTSNTPPPTATNTNEETEKSNE